MTIALHTDSRLGRWRRHIWRPAPGTPLVNVVERVHYFDGTATHRWGRVLPHPSLKLVVSLDEPYREVTPKAVTAFARPTWPAFRPAHW